MNGGPGLSVNDVSGTESQEDRGKQDTGQRATTSAFDKALSQTQPSTDKAGLNGHKSKTNGSSAGHKAKKPAKV